MKNRILFFTTKGCEACKIMNRIIQEAVNNASYDITIEKHCDKLDIAKQYNITDYPTIILLVNDVEWQRHVGTTTRSQLNYWFEDIFK